VTRADLIDLFNLPFSRGPVLIRVDADRRVPRPRRFPPPWSVEETVSSFIVRDANGQALTFVYCKDEPGRRTTGKL
jgi:hypothetical protein